MFGKEKIKGRLRKRRGQGGSSLRDEKKPEGRRKGEKPPQEEGKREIYGRQIGTVPPPCTCSSTSKANEDKKGEGERFSRGTKGESQ